MERHWREFAINQVLNRKRTDEHTQDTKKYFVKGFEIGRVIGSGMIGVALVAKSKGEFPKLFCLKVMMKEKILEKNLMNNIRNEINFMLRLAGLPHILSLEKLIDKDDCIIMVFPYIQKRDLFRYMKEKGGRLPEFECQHIFRQLIQAIRSCHDNNIVHRDIKPENIMIGEGLSVYLGDFGLAQPLETGKLMKGKAGTPCYYPIEMVTDQRYTHKADVWCLGVLLFEMLFGSLPFNKNPHDNGYDQAITKIKVNPMDGRGSREARTLITQML